MVHHRFIIKALTIAAIAITINPVSFARRSFHATVKAASSLTLSIAPAVIVGGNQAAATITLGAAADHDVEVAFKSSNLEVARFTGGVSGPSGTTLFKITKGSVSATVPIRTLGVATRTEVTLEAKAGTDVATARLIVDPASVKTVTVEPAKIVGGFTAKGAVTLNGLAPTNTSVSVQLSRVREAASRTGTTLSTQGSAASLPTSVTIPAGASSASFPIPTTPVSSDTLVKVAANTVREAASRDGSVRTISDGTSNTIAVGELTTTSATATLTVLAPAPSKLILNPASVSGGLGSIGTVVLNGKAPSGGLAVSLTASSPGIVGIPTSVSIPAGSDQANFKITTQTTSSPRSVTIRAALNNLKQIGVSTDNTSDGTSNKITFGEQDGSVRSISSATATFSITPTPPPFTIAVQPTQVTGGAPVAVSLTVQPTASVSSTASSISLTSNHPELLSLPSSVPVGTGTTLSAGVQNVTVNAATNTASADQNVTITATGFSTSASTTLLIKQTPAPPAVVNISATQPNASKDGPVNGIVTVTRSGSTAQLLTVLYSMNDPSAGSNPHPAVNGVDFQQLSGQVIIPAGSSSATISVIPIPDNKHGPELRVIFQLLPPSSGSYTLQSGSNQAVIKIKQHEGP